MAASEDVSTEIDVIAWYVLWSYPNGLIILLVQSSSAVV